MARIIVISRRRTVYTPRAGRPYEVEQTPRVDELIRLGVFYRPHTEGKPAKKAVPAKKAASAAVPAPVVGVTSAPAGEESLVSDPIDHEGAGT